MLNDNEMSISPNVGALSSYLNRVLTGHLPTRMRDEFVKFLRSLPGVGEQAAKVAKRVEESVKALIVPGLLFEELGFRYVGPIPGHELKNLIETFRNVREQFKKPVLVHVITKKGKGYPPAERDPARYHGVGPFDPATGALITRAGAALVHRGLRPGAGARGRPRAAPGRDHRRDDRRDRPGALRRRAPGPLLRRRHRRAARGDVRRRPRLRGDAARGRRLLDLPAARLRPGAARRLPPGAAGGLRARSRRPGRRRRGDAPRGLRPLLPAADAEPRHRGAEGRGRTRAAAPHRARAHRADGAALPARRRGRGGGSGGPRAAAHRHLGDAAPRGRPGDSRRGRVRLPGAGGGAGAREPKGGASGS